MDVSIASMLQVEPEKRNLPWIQKSLQIAIQLEHATIPPYLCALWSIKSSGNQVAKLIRTIEHEEMLHMGLACNMLTTIGGTPQINVPGFVPTYPGPLPGGVRPTLKRVALTRLTKTLVADVFMEIEYPDHRPVALFMGGEIPTIGAFYSALLEAFKQIPDGSITGHRQMVNDELDPGLFAIKNIADVEKAILEIKEQGEGTSQSPLAADFGNEFAHYYKFAEIWHEREIKKTADGWKYEGPEIPFPKEDEIYPMAEVPMGGYPESKEFDKLYTVVLGHLHNAWQNDDPTELSSAVDVMRQLRPIAQSLMQKPLPSGQGNFGPSFLFIPS